MRGRVRTWSDDQLRAAVARNTNFADVLRELGLRPAGGNHLTMKRHIARLGLDISHFSNDRRVRGLRAHREGKQRAFADIFCEGSRVNSSTVRRSARLRVLPRECAFCGNTGEWRGKPLTLQLAHANGRSDDNRLEHLRWLCPI